MPAPCLIAIVRIALAAALLLPGVTLAAGGLVAEVRERGELRCGVSAGIPGFAEQDASGAWHGLEVDYCRALAAAVVGDADAVRFVPLAASMRFPALKLERVDVLLASTSWTLSREALVGVRFAAALFHDGQSFLVPAASAVQEPRDLKGQQVCVEKDTTHSARLLAFVATRDGVALRLRTAASVNEAASDFFAGRCAALSAESAQLVALRARAGAAAADYRLLPQMLSREVLSVAVRPGDPQWETVVRWVGYALLLAEESGLDAGAARATLGGSPDDFARAWGVLGAEEYAMLARALGLEPGWLTRAVAASGNYREIFERNLGAGSALALERGANRLTGDGGLLFAPPLR